MFASFKVATVLAVAAFVAAVPTPPGSGSCSTGSMHCCDSVQPTSSKDDSTLSGLLPMILGGIDTPFGINCAPIGLSGVGSSGTCSSQVACCKDVNTSGSIPIGLSCDPVNLGL